MLVIIRLSYRNRPKLYYFGLLPVKKPFIQLEIAIRMLRDAHERSNLASRMP